MSKYEEIRKELGVTLSDREFYERVKALYEEESVDCEVLSQR